MKTKLLLSEISSYDFKTHSSTNYRINCSIDSKTLGNLSSIKLFLLLFTVLFFSFNCSAATYIFNGTVNNDWNNAANWSPNSVPTSTDDVVIPSGQTIIITASGSSVHNISIQGTLTVNKNVTFTITGNIDVSNGANFNAGIGNSDSATILVYGDFTNNGTANFWKSTVVIAGNLITASTILQNNGNIIVGGNVIGNITGSGTGTVYPVNTNGTVSVTGDASVKSSGTLPTDSTLLALMNEVIYNNNGGSGCGFPITDPSNIYVCVGNTATFTAGASSSSTFQWQVNNGSGWTNTGSSNTGTTSTLTVSNVTSGMNAYKYRALITNGTCTKNGDFANLYLNTSPTISSQSTSAQTICINGTSTAMSVTATGTALTYQWYSNTTASNSGGTAIGSATSATYTPPTNTAGTTYYYCIVSNCILSVTSAVSGAVTVNAIANISSVTGTTPLCVNATATYTANSLVLGGGTGTWSSSATGNATVNSGTGLVTGVAAGTATITYTITGGCGGIKSASQTVTVNPNPSVTITNPTAVCSPGTIDLTVAAVTAGSTAGLTYTYWTNSGATTSYATPTTAAAGTYYIKGTTAAGCFAIAAVNATANPTPTVTTTNPTAVCSPDTIDLTAAAVTAGSTAGLTYTYWTNSGATTSYATPTTAAAGTYYIKGTTAAGCFSIAAVNATVNPTPTVSSISTPATLCSGGSLNPTVPTVTANGSAVTASGWQLETAAGSGTFANLTVPYTVAYTDNGKKIMYYATNSCGTTKSNQITITVKTLPDNTATGFSSTTFCAGNQATITFNANNGSGVLPYSLSYTDGVSLFNASISSNSPTTINLSPNPTNTTNYTLLSITDASGCINSSPSDKTATATINPLPSISFTTQPGANACTNTNVTYTTQSGMSNYTWSIPGILNTDYSIISGGNTTSNTTTLKWLSAGIKTVTINYTNTDGCTAITATSSIATTVNTLPTTPLAGTITQPTCDNIYGQIVLNNLPSGSWTLNPSGITGTSSTLTIAQVLPGTYNYSITVSGCTSAISGNIVINDYTKTWIGSNGGNWFLNNNWSPSGVPTASDCVTLSSNAKNIQISGATPAYANGLTLLNGSSININSTGTLIVTDAIKIDSSSTMNLENNASLIQINHTPNTGTITVTRSSSPAVWADYTYWSSPTHGNQTLFDFSSNSNPKYFLTYDNQWNYAYPKISNFTTGIGYAIAAPINATTTGQVFTYQFTGTPNNGDVSIPVTKGTNHLSKLIGNPYPSALDADKFIKTNSVTNGTISGTLYFWTHNTQTGEADYATYNLSGSTGTGINTTTGAGNKNLPTRWIASGQGFMVEAVSVTTKNVIFNNDMRIIDPTTTNTNFYRSSTNTQAEPQLEKNRIWLNLSHQSQFVNQILVGYIETATNNYDPGFDGTNISNSKTRLYSLIENMPMAIQARSIPFNDNDKVALGFKTETSGNYSISLSDFDGLFTSNQGIYIEDTYLNIIQNIKNKSYDFSTNSGVFEDRFVLRFIDQSLGLSTNTKDPNTLVFLTSDHNLSVKSNKILIHELSIFSITGQLLYSKKDINNLEATVLDLTDHQVYIAKVKMQNGIIENRKIIF